MRQAEKVDLGSDDWTMEIRPYASAFHFPIKELWEYRDLLFLFVRRDFKTMYKQTILGPAWILLSPLLTTGMFSLIFGRIAGISTDGTPAFLFYMAGNILWNYFSSCLSAASSTFIGNAGLFGKVYFPRIVVPASSAVSKLITFGAQFLLFLAAFIKGVDEYQEMLRCCVSYPGNDHRLGGNEAPPAIVSIFLGDELTAILRSIIDGTAYVDITKKKLEIGVDTLPELPQDTTDRNRTSPLAFTGNKFEFRMLGSSQSIASPNVVLNTIMADELKQFADRLEKAESFHQALQELLRDTFRDHQRIIFDGNGYDDDWVQEAKRRGLSNLRDTVDCMPAYIDEKNVALFSRFGILTPEEMHARYEIHLENYCKVTAIEAATLRDMTLRGILPAVTRYTGDLAKGVVRKRQAEMTTSFRVENYLVAQLDALSGDLLEACQAMSRALEAAPAADAGIDAARYYRDQVASRLEEMRSIIDRMEPLVGADYWPYPTYADILFSV